MKQIRERTAAVQAVLNKYMIRPGWGKTPEQPQIRAMIPAADLNDQELIDKAAAAKNGYLFMQLWSGDITGYSSHSEADQALCNILSFWTGRDAGRIDHLFRQSGLMREKWNREQAGTTYGAITIQKAIKDCKKVYDPKNDPLTDLSISYAGQLIYSSSEQTEEQPAQINSAAQPGGNSKDQQTVQQLPTLELVSLDTIEEKEIDWLIEGWIPREAVTILGAEGGVGKTSLWSHIVAKISAGKTTMLDEGYTERPPSKVLYFSSEDSADTVIKKKIRSEGGNMQNIATLDISHPLFNSISFENGGILEALIDRYHPVLCVFDPVQQFIPDRVKMAERNAMRRCLAPLKRLAEVYHTTFIIICHANKRDGASGRKRLADSSDLWDFARSVIMLGKTEDETRYLSQEKNNYGKLQPTILFRITDEGVQFIGHTNKHDDDFVRAMLAKKGAPSLQRQDAEQFIKEILERNDGQMEISALVNAAKEADISENSLKNARSALIKSGEIERVCESKGRGNGTKWMLRLIHTGVVLNDEIPDEFNDYDLNDLSL